jgi:hypothetical protein
VADIRRHATAIIAAMLSGRSTPDRLINIASLLSERSP